MTQSQITLQTIVAHESGPVFSKPCLKAGILKKNLCSLTVTSAHGQKCAGTTLHISTIIRGTK